MIRFLKQLFCNHNIDHDENFYGDEALHRDCRSYFRCIKCGKTFKSFRLWDKDAMYKKYNAANRTSDLFKDYKKEESNESV